MDDDQPSSHHSASQGFIETLLADAPWHAKSFIAAAVATVVGIVSWITDFSSPTVARFGGSYLGGFFIGWAFRRFVKMAALLAGAMLAVIATLKSTGWIDLDWAAVETQIAQGLTSIHQGAEGIKQTLSGYLPSAGAGAAGVFFGFRKK
jgi:uncharacterized membrane protein (Fun14 family)